MTRFGFKYVVGVVSFAVVGALLAPERALGCACCAEPYDYRVYSGLSRFDMWELARLQLVGSWETRFGEADPKFEFRNLDVRLEVADSGWELPYEAWQAQHDALSALPPSQTFDWRVDVLDSGRIVDSILFVYDSATGSSVDMRYILSPSAYSQIVGDEAETVLYKEVKLYGSLKVLGEYLQARGFDFSGPAELRFYGRGNRCFDGADFDEWSLAFQVRKVQLVEKALAHGTIVIKH